jgi:hypothetical protein
MKKFWYSNRDYDLISDEEYAKLFSTERHTMSELGPCIHRSEVWIDGEQFFDGCNNPATRKVWGTNPMCEEHAACIDNLDLCIVCEERPRVRFGGSLKCQECINKAHAEECSGCGDDS